MKRPMRDLRRYVIVILFWTVVLTLITVPLVLKGIYE